MTNDNYAINFADDSDWNTIKNDVARAIKPIPADGLHHNEWKTLLGYYQEAGYSFEEVMALNPGNCEELTEQIFKNAPHKKTKTEARAALYAMAKENGYTLPVVHRIQWTDYQPQKQPEMTISHEAFRQGQESGSNSPNEAKNNASDIMQLRIANAKLLLHQLYADDEEFYICKGRKNQVKLYPAQDTAKPYTLNRLSDTFYNDLYLADKGAYLMLNQVNPQALAEARKNKPDAGIAKAMITSYKYSYIETDPAKDDDIDADDFIEHQKIKLERLDLPWVGMVYSGNESIHVIIRLDAQNQTEFDSRLKKVWQYLEQHKYKYDSSVNNPAKWMRFPVAGRGKKHQYVMAINDNPISYDEWFGKHPELHDVIAGNFFVNNKFCKSDFLYFLKKIGYRKILNRNNEIELVKINGKFIHKATADSIIFEVDNNLKTTLPDECYDACYDEWDRFMSRATEQKFYGLDNIEMALHSDTKEHVYFYFRNGYLDINRNGTAIHPYNDIQGYIWSDTYHSCKHEYHASDGSPSMFEQFIRNVSSRYDEDGILHESPEEFDKMRSAIGYMISRYKDRKNPKAIYITDRKADGEADNSSGGTGKDLIMDAISYIRSAGVMDGKKMDMAERFLFSAYQEQNSLYIFRDIKPSLRMEEMFNNITNDMIIERKGENKIVIPFNQSPKIVLTSNFYLKNMNTPSTRRRVCFIVLENVYNDKHTPYDDFNCCFFDDWNDAEWNRYYDFMAGCVMFYLNHGLLTGNTEEIEQKIKDSSTNDILKIWLELSSNVVDNIKAGVPFSFTDKYADYMRWTSEHRYVSGTKTPTQFANQVQGYYSNKLVKYRKGEGRNKRMWILPEATEAEPEAPSTNNDEESPF